jgi:hypothetical protein
VLAVHVPAAEFVVAQVHPIRHERAKELGAFATPPRPTPQKRHSVTIMLPRYRNRSVVQVSELDSVFTWRTFADGAGCHDLCVAANTAAAWFRR